SLLGGSALRSMSARARERLDRVMPAIFAAAASQPEPLRCLVRLLRLVHAVTRRSVYLALLDEQPSALKRLGAVFSASAFLAERVISHPMLLDDLFDDRVEAMPARDLDDELARRLATLGEADPEAEMDAIQEVRQSALFRIGLALIGGRLDAVAAARNLADVAAAVLRAVLRIAERELAAAHGRPGEAPSQLAPTPPLASQVLRPLVAASTPTAAARERDGDGRPLAADFSLAAGSSLGLAVVAY